MADVAEILRRAGVAARPVWVGCDGALRCGHSGDMVEMLDRLGVPTVGSVPPAWMRERLRTGGLKR